jgi:hypothetical protein
VTTHRFNSLILLAGLLTSAVAGESLPFTVTITPVTPKTLPEYLDNIHAVTKDQSMYQDWPFSPVVIDGEFWVIQKCGYSQTVVRYKGTTIEDAVKQPDGRLNLTHPRWGTVVAPYILGGMWYDPAEKKLYAPLHCEYPSVYGGSDEFGTKLNRQIHLATSTDKGLTWNYEGPIITRDEPGKPQAESAYSGSLWDGGEGDFYLYADESHGYIYIYSSHNLWPKPGNTGPRFWAHHVSRCAISDKLAPGKWQKFYNGAWTEPGLGGEASYVEGCNIIYSSYLKKYLSFNIGTGLSFCSDLARQDWSPSFRIPGGNWARDDVWAWTLTSSDKTNTSRFDKTMNVYTYWHLKPGAVFKLDFENGETPATIGFTGDGVSAPAWANTLNPIRPYGEPLYDNTDPIECRRARKVGCDSPEVSYSGAWTSQAAVVKSKASSTAGNSISFTFKGPGIYWRAATGLDCGKADVFLDDVLQKTVDLYGDFTPWQFAFIKTGLDVNVSHTIKIVVKGEKNAKSAGSVVRHLSFEYSADTNRASDGFSSVLGKNGWHYQSSAGTVRGNLEFNVNKNAWIKPNTSVAVGSDYLAPDESSDAVRRWIAPHAGIVRVEGLVSGDGSTAKILHKNTALWSSRVITHDKPSSHDFNLDVAEGDAIDFCAIKARANWDPVITYVRNKAVFSVDTLRLNMEEHGANPDPQKLAITCTGPAIAHAFHVESDSDWLTVSTVSVAGNSQELRCIVNLSAKATGVYTARLSATHTDVPDVDIPDVLSCNIVVRVGNTPKLVSLSLSPTATATTDNQQFTAHGIDQFGESFNGKALWSVSGGGTIDSGGLFKSDGTHGSFTITCRMADQTATATVDVVSEFLAHWKLNETAGPAADSSGAGLVSKFLGSKGGPAWANVAGRAGLQFNGVDDVMETGTRLRDLRLPFSIALWINPAATQLEYANILGNHDEPFRGIAIQQEGNTMNSFGVGFGDGKQWQGVGPVQLSADVWQHLALVCDGENAILYVNGVEKSKRAATGPFLPNADQEFKLGQGYRSGRFFHGLLSDVRIYRKALTSEAVRAMSAPK